jgi:serine/threonine-protein kinase
MPAARFISETVLSDTGTSRLVRATDTTSGQPVNLRIFPVAEGPEREALRALFTALTSLNHAHLETMHECVDEGGRLIIRLESPTGTALPEVVEKGPLSPAEFRLVTSQLLGGLSAAHAQGIVHGSLNASSIRIARQSGRYHAVITGFGAGFDKNDPAAYHCVPPEQWEQKPARRRSDVYSLGCILYQALSARAPFDGKTLKEVRHKHLKHDVLHLAQQAPQAERWMCDWVMSLMAADGDARPAEAGAALAAYQSAESNSTPAAAMGSPPAPPVMTPPYHQATHTFAVPAYAMPPRATTAQSPVAHRPGPSRPSPRQPGQTGVPRTHATQSHATPSSKKWIVIGAVATAIALASWLSLRGDKQPPERVPSNAPSAAPVKVQSSDSNTTPHASEKYPSHRSKPPAYDRLVIHVMAEAGTMSAAKNAQGMQQKARHDEGVTTWKDLAERARSNDLSLPSSINTSIAPKLTLMKNAPNFPLAADRQFLTFHASGTPPAALRSSEGGLVQDFPFGDSLPMDQRGLTFAVVFFQEIRGEQQTILYAHGKGGNMILRAAENGEIRLNARNASRGKEGKSSTLAAKTGDFHPLDPTLAIGIWRPQPAQIELHVITATGKQLKIGPVDTPGHPTDEIGNLLLARNPMPGPNAPRTDPSPSGLKALSGGIAEVLLYSTALSETDRKSLENQLTGYYFPKTK